MSPAIGAGQFLVFLSANLPRIRATTCTQAMSSLARRIPKPSFTFDARPATTHFSQTTIQPRVESPVTQHKNIGAEAVAAVTKRRNRGDIFRKPTKFKAIDSAVPTKRNALVDLGPVVQKSRAMLVCLGGSLESQLAAARAGVHAACREASELEVARVRGAFFDLQMQYRQLHEQSQAQIARLSHLEAVAKHIVTFCVVGGHYHFAHVARPCSSTRGSDGPV